jgi:seryl-tRNA synthetase
MKNMKNEVKKEVKAVTEEVKAEVKDEILQIPNAPVPDPAVEEISEDKAQPKEAHWVTERSGFHQKSHCSHCGAAAMAAVGCNDESLTPFCPMCGYIMK